MSDTPTAPPPEDLALLVQVTREVARSSRLSPEDAQDFAQTVLVRVVERDYEVFKRFTGRSSLKTYLRVVVVRMLLDWRNGLYGKWRPSVAALRLGSHAVSLDRLMNRDGYTASEAIEVLKRASDPLPVPELLRLVDQLPRRARPRRISDEVLPDLQCVPFDDPISAAETRRTRGRVRSALATAIAQLSREERRLICLRYQRKFSVKAVAAMLETDAKALYRRFDVILQSLRRSLVAAGVSGPAAIDSNRRSLGDVP